MLCIPNEHSQQKEAKCTAMGTDSVLGNVQYDADVARQSEARVALPPTEDSPTVHFIRKDQKVFQGRYIFFYTFAFSISNRLKCYSSSCHMYSHCALYLTLYAVNHDASRNSYC